MLADESMAHGQRLAFHILKASEDTMGKIAFLRLADKLEGTTIGASHTNDAITNVSAWRLLGPDMARRFGDVDDAVLAGRYMDEILELEVANLMKPFLEGQTPMRQAEILRRLVNEKVLDASIDGADISVNFAHAKSAANQLGEIVDDASDAIVRWPDLNAVPLDPRFTDVDPKLSRKLLAFFGDELSQKLNRRPGWLTSFKRWRDHFLDLGVDEYNAKELAKVKAAQEVNSVFFDAEMAPHLVKKMERGIPFFKATYEVASQWLYKMPVAAGGYWPMGVGEFTRKLDRLMQALVETGVATVEEEDGVRSGFVLHAFGKDITLGDPLNPTSFGLLSFFQFAVGASPPGSVLLSEIKAKIPSAGNDRRDVSTGETWLELTERLGVDPVELAQLNRTLFYEEGIGKIAYLSIVGQVADLSTIKVPKGLPVRIPGSGLTSALEELMLPMGEVSIADMPMTFLPASLRNFTASIGLNWTSPEEFWETGEIGGLIGGFIPKQFESSVMSQASEQFMYLESHDLDSNGKGPIARMMAMEIELDKKTGDEANELRAELEQEHLLYIKKVKEGTASSLLIKGMLGQLIPTTPRDIRDNLLEINSYWDSRQYAESLQAGRGEFKVLPFENVEQIEDFLELVGQWLKDDTGEGAKATFARQHPTLLAYLTPKSYFGDNGMPPEITAFDDYVDQIKSEERITPPAFITAMRFYQSSIAVDFHNNIVARYGPDPVEAAAAAINDRGGYRELQETRSDAYMAIDMFDDMNGDVYAQYRKDQRGSDNWDVDRLIEKRRDLQTALSTLLDLADDDDGTIDADELREDAGTFRRALAIVGDSIRSLQDDEELAKFRNPFEDAYLKYFTEYYRPYNEGLQDLYDQIGDTSDSERAQLIYEQIRDYRNEAMEEPVMIDGVRFDNALDYQWSGKSPEEQEIKRQLWLTRPLEWMDLSQARFIIDNHPEVAQFLPSTPEAFLLYHQATIAKIVADEAFEATEITLGERTKIRKAINEELRIRLIEEGRSGEAFFLDLTPYEKLKAADVLPALLDTREYSEMQSYYIEVLTTEDKSADSQWGRETIAPFMTLLTERTEVDPIFYQVVRELGENIFDKSFFDQIFPMLFFDARER